MDKYLVEAAILCKVVKWLKVSFRALSSIFLSTPFPLSFLLSSQVALSLKLWNPIQIYILE